MATPEDQEPGPSIEARADERWLTPLRLNAFASRTWNTITVAFICAIYAGIIAYALHRDASQPPVETAKLEEIPVEIVQPPPPPPPPPKPEAQKPPPPPPELEKPASSAPRAPSEDKIETERMDEATRAPKAETPQDGEKAPPPEPAASPDEAADHDDKSAKADDNDVLKKDAEALTKAVPTPPQKPEKLAKAPPKAKQKREKPAVQRLAGKIDLPDFKLARPTKKAPISGGNEDNRYLSNVFAKIMSKYRPVALDPDFAGTCTVAFHVDDDGTILAMQIAQSSGDEELDEAAVAAVSRASPLPPLPPGAPHGLIARIGANPSGRGLRLGQDE